METRIYWLSFADDTGNLGCCVIKVNEMEMAEDRMDDEFGESDVEERYWIGAAIRKAWRKECNPGGEVQLIRLDDKKEFVGKENVYPYDTLMTKEEAMRLGGRNDANDEPTGSAWNL